MSDSKSIRSESDTSSESTPSEPARLSPLEPPLSSSPGPAVDLEHPWLGLDSFSESHRLFFFGRETEAEALLLRVHNSPLTILYGRSGLGKTSLLRAGLIPRLQDEGARPILLRLDLTRPTPGEGQSAGDPALLPPRPAAQLIASLFPQPQPPFPRENLPTDDLSRLWLHLHRTDAPAPYTHLLFDQFEEIFRGGAELPGFDEDLLAALALLLEGTPPEPVRKALSADRTLLEHFQLTAPPLNLLLSLRDDWLFALNRWRRRLPILGSNHYELLPLRGTAALDAVYEPGALRTHLREENGTLIETDTDARPIIPIEVARRLVRRLAKAADETPLGEISAVPPLLSIVCQQLNADRFKHRGTPDDPIPDQVATTGQAADPDRILRTYYEDSFAGRPPGVRRVIEEQLLSGDGYRQPRRPEFLLQELGAEGIPAGEAQSHLDALLTRRLLTTNQTAEETRLELTHDVLCRIVAESKAAREQREAKERADLEKQKAEEGERQERERAEKLYRMRNALRLALFIAIMAIVISVVLLSQAIFAKREANGLAETNKKLAEQSRADANRLLVAKTKQDLLLQDASRADYLRAQEFFDRDEWAKGLAYLTRALRVWPDNPSASAQLWYLLRHGDASRAFAPERLIAIPNIEAPFVWSPDGRWLSARMNNFVPALIDLKNGDAIYPGKGAGSATDIYRFSNDSRYLVSMDPTYGNGKRLTVGVIDSSRPIKYHQQRSGTDPFSLDGALVIDIQKTVDGIALQIRDTETFEIRQTIQISAGMLSLAPGETLESKDVVWSADGKRIAIAISPKPDVSLIAVLSAESGKLIGKSFRLKSVDDLEFDMSGHFLIARTLQAGGYFLPYESPTGEAMEVKSIWFGHTGQNGKPTLVGNLEDHEVWAVQWQEDLAEKEPPITALRQLTDESPNWVRFSSDRTIVMIMWGWRKFQLFHLPDGAKVSAVETVDQSSQADDLLPDGRHVARHLPKIGIGISSTAEPIIQSDFRLASGAQQSFKESLSKQWKVTSKGDSHFEINSMDPKIGPFRVMLRFPRSNGVFWEADQDALFVERLSEPYTVVPWHPELRTRQEVLEAAELIGGWHFDNMGALEPTPFSERLEWRSRMKVILRGDDGWNKVAQWWLDGRPAPKE